MLGHDRSPILEALPRRPKMPRHPIFGNQKDLRMFQLVFGKSFGRQRRPFSKTVTL
jgi:hypothetical protein